MKTVKFLKTEAVHRVGEEPFTYMEGSTHELRDDRANFRIENGIAVEVKPDKKAKVAVPEATVEPPTSDGIAPINKPPKK